MVYCSVLLCVAACCNGALQWRITVICYLLLTSDALKQVLKTDSGYPKGSGVTRLFFLGTPPMCTLGLPQMLGLGQVVLSICESQ